MKRRLTNNAENILNMFKICYDKTTSIFFCHAKMKFRMLCIHVSQELNNIALHCVVVRLSYDACDKLYS